MARGIPPGPASLRRVADSPPLLAVQELDLAADALHRQRRELPARAAREACEARLRELEAALARIEAGREELESGERALGRDVAAEAEHARDIERRLYDGSVTIAKELASLQDDLAQARRRQAAVEDRELELMERVEAMDQQAASNRADHAKELEQRAALEREIEAAEAEIDAELERIAARRVEPLAAVPPALLAAYQRLREQPKLRGRAAALLGDGSCEGCRVRLPSVEYHRLRHEPADALLHCTHCGRILVRSG